jgi:archaellum component FlaC
MGDASSERDKPRPKQDEGKKKQAGDANDKIEPLDEKVLEQVMRETPL